MLPDMPTSYSSTLCLMCEKGLENAESQRRCIILVKMCFKKNLQSFLGCWISSGQTCRHEQLLDFPFRKRTQIWQCALVCWKAIRFTGMVLHAYTGRYKCYFSTVSGQAWDSYRYHCAGLSRDEFQQSCTCARPIIQRFFFEKDTAF